MDKNRVVIGMSGGVDSSVAAYLLKKQGYEVIGVTMRLFNEIDKCACKSKQDIIEKKARSVCETLDIPHYIVDFSKAFREKVIEYFIREYGKGRTPNPCIACNKYIKYEALLKKAKEMDAYYIATGHYANIIYDNSIEKYIIKKSYAENKDQTYVLYNLTQDLLKHMLMPLGNFKGKDQVREIASKIGLPAAEEKESQEICFIEDNDYVRFIKENATYDIKPGYFVDTNGNIVGKHNGIINYTVGQRKGLGLALGKPVYVVRIDAENNTVVIGYDDEVLGKELIAEDVNFIFMENIEKPMKVKAKIRYNFKEQPAMIYPMENEKVKVIFENPVRAITPGQAVVFYQDDILLGGGIIKEKNR